MPRGLLGMHIFSITAVKEHGMLFLPLPFFVKVKILFGFLQSPKASTDTMKWHKSNLKKRGYMYLQIMYVSDKGPVCRIYKELVQFNSLKDKYLNF